MDGKQQRGALKRTLCPTYFAEELAATPCYRAVFPVPPSPVPGFVTRNGAVPWLKTEPAKVWNCGRSHKRRFGARSLLDQGHPILVDSG